MESNTLKTIQKWMKFGKIFSNVGYVFTIIGFVGCIVGIASLFFLPQNQIFQLGGIKIHGIVEFTEEKSLNLPTIYTSLMIGAVMCLFESAVLRSTVNYFKHELVAGTPFTMAGANELKRLGIKVMVFPLIAVIVSQVVYQVMNYYYPGIIEMNIESAVSIGTGIVLLFLSLVCKYGAELNEKNL